jgi:transcriptional regulator
MYVPHSFREHDLERLADFMREHAFATVVNVVAGVPHATHMPLTLSHDDGSLWLRGHFAKANPQWQALEAGETLAIFTGPHGYVSAEHYDRFESVPTWNYLAVHAYGQARVVADDVALESLLMELVGEHEAGYADRWQRLSERYRDGMKSGIVAFEFRVERLEGASKLSQNKSDAERERIAHALLASGDPAARATGAAMRRRDADLPHAEAASPPAATADDSS